MIHHELVHAVINEVYYGGSVQSLIQLGQRMRIPDWFNEGLASLYEQSSTRNGHIVGLTNWRLAGLQEAIDSAWSLTSFEELMAASEDDFYEDPYGTNYAQSRYLLYHLQEEGLLVTYYEQFFADADADPTGYETLKWVLGRDDIEAFQTEWEAWIMTLTYP